MAIISSILSVIMLLSGGSMYNTIQEAFSNANAIIIYKDGVREFVSNDSHRYKDVLDNFLEMIKESKQMPAFGVSLDALTKDELKKGMWVEFVYNTTQTNFDMPFDSLLINVQDNYQGFNVIRGNDGKYEGRCFYIDLKGSMHTFYEFLK